MNLSLHTESLSFPNNFNPAYESFTDETSQTIRNWGVNFFSGLDRFFSFPVASAEPMIVSFENADHKNDAFNAFEGGTAGFERMKKRTDITSSATESLAYLCEHDLEKCVNSPERQDATRKLEELLTEAYSSDPNLEIQDCYASEHCNPIGCKPADLLSKLNKTETICSTIMEEKSYLKSCSAAKQVAMNFVAHLIWDMPLGNDFPCTEDFYYETPVTKCETIDTFKYCKVHAREKEAGEVIHTRVSISNWAKSFFYPPEWKDYLEFLRFRADDPREKCLFLSADSDHNDALAAKYDASILVPLSQKFDLKYKVVKNVDEMRKAIDSAAKTGKLSTIVIVGHANPEDICLNKCKQNETPDWNEKIHRNRTDFDAIFSKLQPNGKILLSACNAGASKYDVKDKNGNIVKRISYVDKNGKLTNLAQKMADGAKRTVIAANETIVGPLTSLLSQDTTMLYHPSRSLTSSTPFYDANIFKPFKPTFYECSSIKKDKINKKELKANKTIKNDLNNKTLLTETEKKASGLYLRLCKDDPREKLLYLAALYDPNGLLDPERESNLLGLLADKYDLEYRIIASQNEMCQTIDYAAEFGNIAGVVIAAQGLSKELPSKGLILSNGMLMTAKDDYSKCFAKLKKNAAIILSGGSVGQDEANSNLAQKIADDSQRTVIAPTCPINPSKITVQAIDPLVFHHPSKSFFENLFGDCPENNHNLFKTFEPKKKS